MKVLGFGGPFFLHDPAAAILVDGKVVAAAEEERFTRKKHAIGQPCIQAIKYCLKEAALSPEDIDAVAFPWSSTEYNRKKWSYALKTIFSEPSRAYKTLVKSGGKVRETKRMVYETLEKVGVKINKNKIFFVEHHLAHAASAYLLSGYEEAAIMTIDGSGEFTSTLFAEGKGGKIRKIKEIDLPDSIGRFYSTVTAYLGFHPNNGEYKVMGMAPYGDPEKADLSKMISYKNKSFKINPDYVWPIRRRRYDKDSMAPKKLVELFGPPRTGDNLNEPFTHIAASAQKRFEEVISKLMEDHLGDILKKNGNLVFAGGCALNVVLNRHLRAHKLVKNLFVQPASHDAGTSLGAACYVSNMLGDKVKPMHDVYLGPSYNDLEIEKLLNKKNISFKKESDIEKVVAGLLSEGHIVGWMQGRMEYGPRALGNRSILGHPALHGTSDRINEMIKFREKWRPFCPSMLREHSKDILGVDRDAPFMTTSFLVNKEWKNRIPEVVHINNTLRPQTVSRENNPKFHKLLKYFHEKTGIPVLINTSLNRRGEPMACSPEDAIDVFKGSGLDYMVIGNYLIDRNDIYK